MMPGDGWHLAHRRRAQRIDPTLGAIVMTGHGTIDTAVHAMQIGALDYILEAVQAERHPARCSRARSTCSACDARTRSCRSASGNRSEELAAAYQSLESFSYSISHDLRSAAAHHRQLRADPGGGFRGALGRGGQADHRHHPRRQQEDGSAHRRAAGILARRAGTPSTWPRST